MRLLRSRKAVSPVLATIMMIVVSTAASVTSLAFSGGMMGSQIGMASEKLVIENVYFDFTTSANAIGVVLRNNGLTNVDIQKVYVNNNEHTSVTHAGTLYAGATADLPYTLVKQDTGWFKITVTVGKSTVYRIKLVTVQGLAVEGAFTSPAE